MKKYSFLLFLIITFVHCSLIEEQEHKTVFDLTEIWDTLRVLENPDKGWYHHLLDNGIGKYPIRDNQKFLNFPGMDHLYIRLAWSYLEPEEGEFNWSYIDDVVEKYVPLGYGISFRISSKETGIEPETVPTKVDGVGYATPYWVKKAGAQGVDRPEFGSPSWTPDWDDPVYLEKLDNFYKAFAERYDGLPYVRYIDVGSIGDWGEGHTHFSTRIPPTVDEVKANIHIFLKHFKKTQIVVTDDLIYWNKPENEVIELLQFVHDNGITFRDDSPLVDWYIENNLDTWSVSHPRFFDAVYKNKPTVFELQHYGMVKDDGNWLGKNGEKIIPQIGVSGADILRNSIKLMHATYIGYHGYLEDWLDENPDLTKELQNLCGYWYFPKTIEFINSNSSALSFNIEWLNKGVAPAYSDYLLKTRLINKRNTKEYVEFEIENSGNRNWLPMESTIEKYTVNIEKELKGTFLLAIQLYDKKSEKPVKLGLKTEIENTIGFYNIAEVNF